ncbi:MAG TPA: type I-U CRISPR-associated helicase/endonuclease Cas3 [Candidatus Paceibacterota bacterium]|nr:type I-U CRISPR-associated helicase/endonuclease Cas3 [Candidatus Paceibacterota bacterium]
MTSLNFAEFFREVHGVPPLPWQNRLARQLAEGQEWPDLIDLPTASGKTACIDIALFHLASCAQRGEPWKAARRIVFVVDRRIIVDAAADRAQRIRAALANSKSQAVRSVADCLKGLGGEEALSCMKLRGGMAREPSVSLNPVQPMIITSTIDQIGSRLLFRGYGLTPYAAPLHAGLLGHDTLVLLDEAHLGVPFASTVRSIAREQARAERPLNPVKPVRIVPMSATSREEGRRFGLDEDDLANEIISERRTSPKTVRLKEVTPKLSERVKALRQETLALFKALDSSTPAVAVIVNRVKTARDLFETLKEEASNLDCQVELLIGRSRPLERDVVARRVIDRAGVGAERSGRRGLIVVATQTIEVGADLDFEGIVTECASVDALLQRFGRLDRLGKFRKSRGVIIGSDEVSDDPIYGAALAETWRWLHSIASMQDESHSLNFSIESMEAALKTADLQKLKGKSPTQLELAPAFVDLLCQTSPAPEYQPDVAALLHGQNAAAPEVQVVWRAEVPGSDDGKFYNRPEIVSELLELNPPSSLEAVSLPLHVVRAWLEGRSGDQALADMEGERPDDEANETDGKAARLAWRRTYGKRRNDAENAWHQIFPREIRPGDTIVVPVSYGGCDQFGFSPNSTEQVSDLSAASRKELRRSPLWIVTESTIQNVKGFDAEVGKATWQELAATYADQSGPELLSALRSAFGPGLLIEYPWLAQDTAVDLLSDDAADGGQLHAVVITSRGACAGDISDEDLSSSRTIPIPLDTHSAGVGERARLFAASVGLDATLVGTVQCAGSRHDLGKADPRFQTMLRAGDDSVFPGQLLAKGMRSARGIRVELGERHEAYSVALLRADPGLVSQCHDPELALYLVGTHHGRGRALMPDRADQGTVFSVSVDGVSHFFEGVPALGSLGSGWADLFWKLNRRYGAWGLAYMEAVLRLADQLQSVSELTTGVRK